MGAIHSFDWRIDPVERHGQRIIIGIRKNRIVGKNRRARLDGRRAPKELPEICLLQFPIFAEGKRILDLQSNRQRHQRRG